MTKEKPIIIAITPFHNYIADFLPDSKIIEYLYGFSHKTEITENRLELKEVKTLIHTDINQRKYFPIFSINRMLRILVLLYLLIIAMFTSLIEWVIKKGFGDSNTIIVRSGISYDPKPHSVGKEFNNHIKFGEITESWNESVSVFHNPNAKYPIDKNIFSDYRQLWLTGDSIFDVAFPDFFFTTL